MLSKFDFPAIEKKAAEMKVDIPNILANKGSNYFNGAFRKEGWGKSKWARPQRQISGTKANKYAKPPRQPDKKILVNTGNLRRQVGRSLQHATWEEILWRVDCKYAAVHNEGFHGTVNVPEHTSHRFKKIQFQHKGRTHGGKRPGKRFKVKASTMKMNIDKRQFMGMNDELKEQMVKTLESQVKKIFA